MGKPWSGSAEVSMTACSSSVPVAADVSLTACSPSVHVTDESIRKKVSLSSLPGSADISKQLDFSYGHKFKTNVRKRLASTVHPLGKSNHFLLVVSFGRANFKLTEDMAAIALESCIGGIAEDLMVQCLHDRVFRFFVASKAVGFMVHALRSFSCSSFKCYFHLWSNGGPFWYKEFIKWQAECDKEWILVSPNKKRTDKAMAALRTTPQKSALSARKADSVKKRLSFAT
jgi:hypothetical protein